MEGPNQERLLGKNRSDLVSPTIQIVEPNGSTIKVGSDDLSESITGDDNYINDDLVSVSNSSRANNLTRSSFDSNSIRRSFDSSVNGRSRAFGFGNEIHSGSEDYSPLGNNSIYEIVMNTRRKNWLNYPTSLEIPPISLKKNVISSDWRKQIDQYVNSIKKDYTVFEDKNSLRNMNRIEQIKNLESINSSTEVQNDDEDEDIDENDENYISKLKSRNKEIAEVPDFYFDADFKLDNPRIFNRVLDGVQLQPNNLNDSDNKNRDASFTELDDKLNDYLDSIESLLVVEISKSSHKFFQTLGNVDTIQEKINHSIDGLDKLTETLEKLKVEEIEKKIQNQKIVLKERNVEKLEQGLLQVKLVLQETENVKKLYNEGEDYDRCMELINSIGEIINGDKKSEDPDLIEWTKDWPHPLTDLRAVASLLDTREYLTNMKIEIGGKYSLMLCDVLLKDLNEYCDSITTNDSLQRLQNKLRNRKFLHVEDDLQNEVTKLVIKLFDCEELTSAFSVYQDRSVVELKSIIKKYLPQEDEVHHVTHTNKESGVAPQQQRQSSSGSRLSKLIKEQTSQEFYDMLVKTFTHASEAIRRLYRHQKLLLDISLNEIMKSGQNSARNEHDMITQLDIRNGINESIRIVQLRMGKIIVVRRDLTSNLTYEEFLKIYSICVLFIQECEAVSGEFLTKYLSDVLSSQIKHFINMRYNANVSKLNQYIEKELWVPFIVDPKVQKDVNDIVSSMDMDPLPWANMLELSFAPEDTTETTPTNTGTDDTGTELQKTDQQTEQSSNPETKISAPRSGHRKSVVVEDKTFVATEALIKTISMIKEILIVATNLPSIYLPNLEKLAYDILKAFNTNILALFNDSTKKSKNYSIMSESLDCLVEFIKIVQRFFRRLSTSQSSKIRNINQKDPQIDYIKLLQLYQTTLEKLYMANAPPPA